MKTLLAFLFFIAALATQAQTTINVINPSASAIGVQIWALGSGYPDSDRYLIFPSPAGVYIVPPNTNVSYTEATLSAGNSSHTAYGGTAYMTAGSITNSSQSGAQVQSWSASGYPGAASGAINLTFYVTGAPPSYTNYTGTVVNNLGVTAVATWYFNGALVQTETLAPGQSGSWTTPPIETSPVAQVYTFTASVNPAGNSIGYNADGSPNFTGGSTGGGVSDTLSGAGSSQTNSLGGTGTSAGGSATLTTNGLSVDSGTNSELMIGTNLVAWSPPTGLASESTLEAAATLAHSDSVNLLQGEAVLHGDLGVVTNELGQLIGGVSSNNILNLNADTYLASINTNIAREIQIASTNGDFVIQSNTAIYNTNIADIYLTNYAEETTLEGISNLMAINIKTNNLSNTNNSDHSNVFWSMMPAAMTNADAATAAAENAEGDYGIVSLLDLLSPQLPPLGSSPPDMTVTIADQTYNLDPVLLFPNVSTLCLDGFTVVLLLAFLIDVSRMFWQLVAARANTSSGGVPDMDFFGTNLVGFLVAIVIPAVFVFLFSTAMNYLFANMGVSVAQAMNSSIIASDMGSGAYYLLSSFFPVNLFFSLICTRIILQFTLGKIFGLASMAARWLPGK